MKVILPLRAEFGLKLWWFVPAVHAIDDPEKVVFIEPGEEALYPSAARLIEVDRQEDSLRRNRYSRDRDFVSFQKLRAIQMFGGDADFVEPAPSWPGKRFVPEPRQRVGITCDVVVAPRKRSYGAEKNWPHWGTLTNGLKASGYDVFAAGAPDSSYDVNLHRAWDHERFFDASLEAILASKLVISTDAGIAHLAVLCGKPLLMITHGEGLVAPGPSSDENGRVMDEQYWPVKIDRYREANHLGAPIMLLHHAWYDPGLVIDAAGMWLDPSRPLENCLCSVVRVGASGHGGMVEP
jgi:hypothetical protein